MQPYKASRALLFAALIGFSGFFTQSAQSAAAPDVKEALLEWKTSVEAADMDAIMALYAQDAIMISTFAQKPLTERKQIEGFFQMVVVNPDIKVEILESHPRTYDKMATNSGRYALSYTQEGEQVVVPARYTFVYKLDNGKWMVVEHHSSRMPVGESKGDAKLPVADTEE